MRLTRVRRGQQRARQRRLRIWANLLLVSGVILLVSPFSPWPLVPWPLVAWSPYSVAATADQDNPVVGPAPPLPEPALAPDLPAPTAASPPPSQSSRPEPPAASPSGVAAHLPYTIELPTIGARFTVSAGIDNAALSRGPGQYPQTPLPGLAGNAAIAGHRTLGGRPSFFFALNRLKPGDPIRVTYPAQVLTFAVERVFVVGPYELSVLAPTPEPVLTLTTCDPPGTDRNRLIVRARLNGQPPGRANGSLGNRDPAALAADGSLAQWDLEETNDFRAE